MKKICVVKIGSRVLLTNKHLLDEKRIEHIADQIKILIERGDGVILVVSGSVAFGSNYIKSHQNSNLLRQAAAAVGQVQLISHFNDIFATKQLQIAQILLTKKDMLTSSQKQKITQIINFYLDENIIPIINENDVVDLNSFGGNDILAAEIATLMQAHKLIILSTMNVSKFGIGGTTTKHRALEIVKMKNIQARIVNGKVSNVLLKTFI